MSSNIDHHHRKNSSHRSPAKQFLSLVGIVMFGLYLILGMVILLWSDFPLEMRREYRVLFGLLLIVYSFIRFIRLWGHRVDDL